MTALWHLTGPTIPVSPADPSPFGRRFDSVVVGAGLTGLVTAVLLARAGQRVAVLEARTVGAVTTGHTSGKLSLLQGSVYSQVRKHVGDDALCAYAEANREGQAWMIRELERLGLPVDRRDAVTFANDEASLDDLERELDACRVAGVDARWADDTGLPFATAGAIALEQQVQLQPIDVLAALAAELLERGGEIHERMRVQGVEENGDELEVQTSAGTVAAERCVLATGVPFLDRGLFFARLEPSRSFVTAYDVPEDRIPRGMHVSIDAPDRSLRTARGTGGETLVLVGGGGHTTGRGGDTVRTLAELDAWAQEQLGAGPRVSWWAAQDYQRHASLPYAGPLAGGHGRIYTATGYDKWGMTNAVAASLAIVSQMLGGRLDWAKTMRHAGPGVAGVADAVRVNAKVAAHVAGDWTRAVLSGSGAVDLAEGEGRVVREGAHPVAESRVDGRVCRVSAVCTHLGGILNWNPAERSWDCPLHASRFSAAGEVLEGPAVRDLAQARDDRAGAEG
ncbi:FAD-dependent oxidoreductase [Leucobacter sp. USCH14]|uniref:FAD-dependent oxidoreductase n=1 Tax=Leucobacter sp. USCH14 TaxID=3024838 RepID=UPI0030AF36FF